jgi:hypothetical protein
MILKEGDIVYFEKEFRSHYSSGYYYHKTNQPYLVIKWSLGYETRIIENLSDGVNHFVHSGISEILIPESLWKSKNRHKKLNKLFKCINKKINKSLEI